MLEVGQTIEVIVNEVDRFAQGVAKYNEQVIFIQGLLESEKALVTITKVKTKYAKAVIKKILLQSPLRKTTTSKLGALDLYHLKDQEQITWQYNITKQALERNLGFEGNINETLYDENQLNYRNKVVYHVLDDTFMRLGLYRNEPIELMEVHTFILNSLAIQRCIAKIQQQSLIIDPTVFKHVVLRSNEREQVLVTLVATKPKFDGLNELVSVIRNFKEVVGITLNIKPNENTILGQESILLYGKNEIAFKIEDLFLKINDRSFMQVNNSMMLKTYNLIKSYINEESVIDCYSGIGSIGFHLGDKATKVTMIENNIENINMANNLKSHYKGKFSIVHGDAKKMLPAYDADVLVIDPPRTGLHETMIPVIIKKQFKKIIYLSCELNTLIRDLKLLENDYEIVEVTPVRMFPQTTSIETLVLLQRK